MYELDDERNSGSVFDSRIGVLVSLKGVNTELSVTAIVILIIELECMSLMMSVTVGVFLMLIQN